MKDVVLDGKRMTSAEEAHRYLAGALDFPPYYGGNLDALADCLSELGEGVSVELKNAGAMRAQLGGYAESLLRVFEDVSGSPGAFRFRVRGRRKAPPADGGQGAK